MRLLGPGGLLRRPGSVLTALVLVAVPGWLALLGSLTAGGVLTGWVGALVGLLAELAALQVGMLVGALACGVRVHHLVVGVGAKVREWNPPGRRVVLRALPVLVQVGIGPNRAPVRPRMWGAALCSALLGLLVAALLMTTAPLDAGGGAFGVGLALGGGAAFLHALPPRRGPGFTTTGWFLFRLLGLTGRPAAELDAAPLVAATTDALDRGDLAVADRESERLLAEHPALRTAVGARAAVLSALGRYGDGLRLVSALIAGPGQEPREVAIVLAGMAGLTAAAVEAGELPAEVGVPAAQRALDGARELGYPSYRLTGTLGLIALVTGDPATAARLAEQGAELGDSPLGRADDLATVARAHMAAGDNAAARAALARAESLAGWLPRVRTTRERLDIR
jgi:hypothetical protein